MIIIVIIGLIMMSWGVFGCHDSDNVTDFELYGDIDPYIYGKCQENKEYERGYLLAREEIKNTDNAKKQ